MLPASIREGLVERLADSYKPALFHLEEALILLSQMFDDLVAVLEELLEILERRSG